MAFSQSFSFGEDTLNLLDYGEKDKKNDFETPPCKKRNTASATTSKVDALRNDSNNNSNANQRKTTTGRSPPKLGMEIIEESPTEVRPALGRSIKERLRNASASSSHSKSRKQLRRSKSDPVASPSATFTRRKHPIEIVTHDSDSDDFISIFGNVPSQSSHSVGHRIDLECDSFEKYVENIQSQPRNNAEVKHKEPSLMAENLSDFFSSEFNIQLDEEVNVSRIESLIKSQANQQNVNETKVSTKANASNFEATDQSAKNCSGVVWEESIYFDEININQIVNTMRDESIRNETFVEAAVDESIRNEEVNASAINDSDLNFCKLEVSCALSEFGSQLLNDSVTPQAMSTQVVQSIVASAHESTLTPPVQLQQLPSETEFEDKTDLKMLSSWGCNGVILREYRKKGFAKMFEWQAECLSHLRNTNENGNLVYSAPTSAGKTFVSEILMIYNVLKRRKKVLIILPFISVVREKMYNLQDLLRSSGVRVEGFFGGYTPAGGFESVDVAICTIEKANSIVNRLLEQSKIDAIGLIVVDEVHLISDPGRGYILELLLAKTLFCSKKLSAEIQIVAMSATLPNAELLNRWLRATFYQTHFRPIALNEMIKIGSDLFDNRMNFLRSISSRSDDEFDWITEHNDQDDVARLCLETIVDGTAAIVFCPSKDWCETLALNIASLIYRGGKRQGVFGEKLRQQIDMQAIADVKIHLRNSPTGLDTVLEKTVSYGVAFHHAGLTFDERDILESAFSNGSLRVIVATSTLSSGVNLPARRVIIRTPLFGGKPMSSLTYKQMIGRAGRMGKDTLGESILICTPANAKAGKELIGAELRPLTSCLDADGHTHLKRAILEIIASNMATTGTELEQFIKCTLFYSEKSFDVSYFKSIESTSRKVKKSNMKNTDDDDDDDEESLTDPIAQCMEFLEKYEFIRIHRNAESNEMSFTATRLGLACLASSMPPNEGFMLFSELQRARQSFVLESELHAVYLVTPFSVCYQLQDLDWLAYLDLWEKLTPPMQRVGEHVGIRESFLVKAMRGTSKIDPKLLKIHKRFYTALALQELIDETPVSVVAAKYKFTRGVLQSLQQTASTFAGIVSSFCNALNWQLLGLIVTQFKQRLFFGVHQDLVDLMRISSLNGQRARALFQAGFQTLADLSKADILTIEKCLYDSISFDTRQRDGETNYDAEQRNKKRMFFVTGKAGLTVQEAARMIVDEARNFIRNEIGMANVVWTQADVKTNEESGQSDTRSESNLTKTILFQQSDDSIDLNVSGDEQEALAMGVTPLGDDQVNERSRNESLSDIEIIDVCDDASKLEQLRNELNDVEARDDAKLIGFCVAIARKTVSETTMKCILSDDLYVQGISICCGENSVNFVNLQDHDDCVVQFEAKINFLNEILRRTDLVLCLENAKDQLKILANVIPDLASIECSIADPKIAHWLLLKKDEINVTDWTIQKLANIYAIDCVPLARHALGERRIKTGPKYRSGVHARITCEIVQNQLVKLRKSGSGNLLKVFREVEMPIQKILLNMEVHGIGSDKRAMETLNTEINDAMVELEEEMYRINGKRFRTTSSREVAHILKVRKKDGTISARCTRSDIESSSHPIAKLILEHRKLGAILSKNIQPLLRRIAGNRIHGNSVSFTTTGRISMHEPNLQNVAKDFSVDCLGVDKKRIISCRSAFSVAAGRELISADFCQLELRVLAHLSDDDSLKNIFSSVEDVFTAITAKWNRIDQIQVTDQMRNKTKQICYGIIYGMGVKSLADTMECDEGEASCLIESFHQTYPGIRNLTEKIVQAARTNGYVETLAGRRRYLPHIGINSEPAKRSQSERQAINTTIQGSAADIAKYAMLRMERNLTKYQPMLKINLTGEPSSHVYLVLHLHDELMYEVPANRSRQIMKILKSSMENCAKLSVPLRVKLKKGPNWGEMTKVEHELNQTSGQNDLNEIRLKKNKQ